MCGNGFKRLASERGRPLGRSIAQAEHANHASILVDHWQSAELLAFHSSFVTISKIENGPLRREQIIGPTTRLKLLQVPNVISLSCSKKI